MAAGDEAVGSRYAGRRHARGFTYVAVLFALAIFGVGLAALGESWSASARREREAELIEIGSAYIQAIDSYYRRSPGALKAYPRRLDQLLEDGRFVGTVRHLRQLYPDPVQGAEWALVRAADGGIQGVYSPSERLALRMQALRVRAALPVGGVRYVDWKFIHDPDQERSDVRTVR